MSFSREIEMEELSNPGFPHKVTKSLSELLPSTNLPSVRRIFSANDSNPLHKRKRSSTMSPTSEHLAQDDCLLYSPFSPEEMTRDAGISADVSTASSLVNAVSCDLEAGTVGRKLEAEFKLGRKWVRVRLMRSELVWQDSVGPEFWGVSKCTAKKGGRVPFSEILSAVHLPPSERCTDRCCCQEVHRMEVHTFVRKRGNKNDWVPTSYTFASEDGAMVSSMVTELNSTIAKNNERPTSLWVFINPFGGAGQAKRIWKNKVYGIFQKAGVKCVVVYTTHADHAKELLKSAAEDEIRKYDGVVAVGGDGLFQEILTGVLERSDKPWSDANPTQQHVRLGHIPAGSTDAVAWSVNGSRSVKSAALKIALGDRLPLDVMRIDKGFGNSRYSVCLAGYGFMGDTARASEKLRFLGPLRYDIAGALVFVRGRKHRARVIYKPSGPPPPAAQQICYNSCGWCEATDREPLLHDTPPSWCPLEEMPASEMLSVNPTFKSLEGEFLSIIATVTSCRTDKSQHGLTPHAHLGDGRMHLILVRKTSRFKYFRFLLSIMKNGVTAGKHDFVEVLDASAVCVEPVNGRSVWNVDGEIVKEQTISAVVHRGLVEVFARGIEN